MADAHPTQVPFVFDNPYRSRQPRAARRAAALAYEGLTWSARYRTRLFVSDTLVVLIATLAALAVTAGTAADLVVAASIVLLWSVALEGYRTRGSRVIGVGASEYRRVASASGLSFGALAVAAMVMSVPEARPFFLVAFPVGTLALLASRWSWRRWLTTQRGRGHYLSRAVVVGPVRDVMDVARRIEKSSGAAYTVVGAVIDDHDSPAVSVAGRNIPVLACPDGIASAVRGVGADAVIVAGQRSGDQGFVRGLGWMLEETSAELVLASGLTDVAGPRIHMRPVEGLPLMHVELPNFEGGKHLLKRVFDIVASGLALLLFLPLLAVIAVLIRRDSPGPVLFRQERVGKDGRSFAMLKFRSMVQTAEQDLPGLLDQNEGAGVLFKMRNDPRITRLGHILRKYSLDELPQLWNILTGQMSLVGPRPPLQREVSAYEMHVNRRLYIKPGLTGLWQVSGRSDLSWDESVRLDLYYVENWSLTGDLVIIWRTVKVMLQPSGAY